MDKKDRHYLAAGCGLLAAALVFKVLARSLPGFATWYAHTGYKWIVEILGRLSGVFPCSVVEILLYILILLCVVYLVKNWRKPLRIASRAVCLAGVLLFSYMANCGINYYAVPFSSYAGLETGTYTKEELRQLCSFLAEQVNLYAPGRSEVPDDQYEYRKNRSAWRAESVQAMQAAGEAFPALAGFYPKPKEVAVSWILSVQQLCGIYSPFTIEANYNGDMPNYNVPHTMCHELSHLKGFMREDEANFIGYLACISSEDPSFCYSGYLTGWVYAGNALASADPETYLTLYGQLCEPARRNLAENNAYWNRYEGRVAEAATQWNDTYLKMNDQEDGVRSYGRMVDLMLAYAENQELQNRK